MTLARLTDHLTGSPALWRSGRRYWLLLFVILSIALGLRLYGINWDQGGLFHPDERAILMRVNDLDFPAPSEVGNLVDPEISPLNPGWFNYGSLPLYALGAVKAVLSPATDLDLFDLRIPGRAVSALADTATVALIFLIGVRWFSLRVGVVAALLAAFAVIHIQLSHFFAVDGVMTLFIVAGVFFSIRVARSGRRLDSLLAGLMVGLGLATKFSVAPLVLTVIAAHLIYAFSKPGDALSFGDEDVEAVAWRRWIAASGLVMSGAAALVALLVTQPYMVLDSETFVANVSEQSEMVRRIRDYPYTRQYVETTSYLYQITQLGIWGLGPVAGVVAWVGLGYGLVSAWVARRKVDLVILSWVIPYLLITGWFDVKFMRYMLPLTPFLLLYGARFLWWAGDSLRTLLPKYKFVVFVPAVIVVAATAHYALSFTSIYSGDHPAQKVSVWLDENAPTGSLVLQEHWEEGIPHVPGLYYDRLELYNHDSREKFDQIAMQLADGEYLVLFSNRLYGTIPRLPERYPTSTRYYEALFDGSLGYELVYSADKTASFLGVAYDDDPFARVNFSAADYEPPSGGLATLRFGWADESFTVYDHPKNFVFENTGKLDQAEIISLLGFETSLAQPERPVGLLLSEDAAKTQQAGGTWTDLVFLRGLPNVATPFVWYLAIQLVALAAIPLAFVVFRPLPDRGYLLAKPLGLLLVATIAWLMASYGLMGFSFASVIVALLATAGLSTLAWWRYGREIAGYLKQRWRFVLGLEALFLIAFLAFLAVRLANPDLWHPWRGGEKPMDFAYLNAVARSTIMPPYDPWFAGGFLNYYYYGQFIVATMLRLTGIIPHVAYNIAVPMIFALTAGAAFSVVYNLAAMTLRSRGAPLGSMRSPIYAGLGAVILVAVAGNIDGLIQFGEKFRAAVIDRVPAAGFDYWQSSRMMAADSPGHEITEFPYFTFLYADLHAHLIAIPFAIMGLGLGIAVLARSGVRRPKLEMWGALALLGLVIGALRIINAWDFPTALLLAGVFVLGGELMGPPAGLVNRIGAGLAKWVFVAAVSYLVFLPFHQNFELFNNGLELSKTRTPFWRYLAIHSIFLFILLTWFAHYWRTGMLASRRGAAAVLERRGIAWIGLQVIVAVAASGLLASILAGYATAAITLGAAMALGAVGLVTALTFRPDSRYVYAAVAIAAVALLLGGGVDLITVEGDIGRMNTVFKFYLQAWVLLALASAYFAWTLAEAGYFSLRKLTVGRTVWLVVFAALTIGILIYPVLGTRARIVNRFNTIGMGIDGMAYMDEAVFVDESGAIELGNERPAIRHMQTAVQGSPVIIEGLTDLYRWGNRFAVYTGLPSVVGWDWHQRQQRVGYAFAVTERRADVDRFYRTINTDTALKTLDEFNVRYVIVGQLERNLYPDISLAKFDRMEEQGLTIFYQDEWTTIYEYTPIERGESSMGDS